MRSARLHFVRSEELQKRAERLLGYILFGQSRLEQQDTANRAMQHREEHENQQSFNEYRLRGTFDIPDVEKPSWPHPVVTGGRLYLREQDALLAYDVRK